MERVWYSMIFHALFVGSELTCFQTFTLELFFAIKPPTPPKKKKVYLLLIKHAK